MDREDAGQRVDRLKLLFQVRETADLIDRYRNGHVMHLMHHPIQAERQETKYAEDHTIEFIQTTALSQQAMARD